MLIFKREPALWLALIAITVKVVSAFAIEVTDEQQTWINAAAAALVGLILAVVAHDGIGAAVLGAVQAVLALAVGFGLHWSAEQQAVVLAFATAIVGMFDRTQVTAPVPAAASRPSRPVSSL
ncbi:hypothetical protein J1792_16020 [Streptomyces triculaminicus]|uniref:Uncharacterized protein n=1 Tax=Streptomyces triculaminicus TaxID=2816232 RepID=A0A939JP77_9ACTN|nr:hypothetical protein [Streptomyces triculaminicus]MBO0654223.1 hypothetical protein [Streptomyces triculaminicus]